MIPELLKNQLLEFLNNEEFKKSLAINFPRYLAANPELMVIVTDIQSKEKINITDEQKCAALLLFIEAIYESHLESIAEEKKSGIEEQKLLEEAKAKKSINPAYQTKEAAIKKLEVIESKWTPILRKFTLVIDQQPAFVARDFETNYPNFISILNHGRHLIELESPKKSASHEHQPNTVLKTQTVAVENQTMESNPLKKSDVSNSQLIAIMSLKDRIERKLAALTKRSFFSKLFNTKPNYPQLEKLLKYLLSFDKFLNVTEEAQWIEYFSRNIVLNIEQFNPNERKIALDLMTEIIQFLPTILENNSNLAEKLQHLKTDFFRCQSIDRIQTYLEKRAPRFNKYFLFDLKYRNTGNKPPIYTKAYKIKHTFTKTNDKDEEIGIRTKLKQAKTAKDFLELIKDISKEINKFYKNAKNNDPRSASKGILFELQDQSLTLLKKLFPSATKTIIEAERIVESNLCKKILEKLNECRNMRQSITKNPLKVFLKDKMSDNARIEFLNKIDWLESIAKNILKLDTWLEDFLKDIISSEKLDEQQKIVSEQKQRIYLQYVEASAYALALLKDQNDDIRKSLLDNQYTLVFRLLEQVEDLSTFDKTPIYQRIYHALNFQQPNSSAAQLVKDEMIKLNISEGPNTFATDIENRYKAWEAVETVRRNKEKIDIFAATMSGVLKDLMNKPRDPSAATQIMGLIKNLTAIPLLEVKIPIHILNAGNQVYNLLYPDYPAYNDLQNSTAEDADKLRVLIVERFIQTFQNKITCLHYDTSIDGRNMIHEMAFYAAQRAYRALNSYFEGVLKKDTKKEKDLENLITSVIKEVMSEPMYHSVIPLKSTTIRLQNDKKIKINLGRGLDANEFFLSGDVLKFENNMIVYSQCANAAPQLGFFVHPELPARAAKRKAAEQKFESDTASNAYSSMQAQR